MTQKQPLHIILISTCTEDLAALEKFLIDLYELKDACILIPVQLNEVYQKKLSHLIHQRTKFEVTVAGNGSILKEGNIYVSPADKVITFLNQKIVLQNAAGPDGLNAFVETFYASYDHKINLTCIVLSENYNAAFAGLKTIKANNGYIIAQEQETQKSFRAIQSGVVDAMLDVEGTVFLVKKITQGKIKVFDSSVKEENTGSSGHRLGAAPYLEAIVKQIDGILWEADAKTFEFSYISPQVRKILGYTPEEWLSEPGFWQKNIHPEDRDYALTTCHKETRSGRDHIFEYRMLAKDGSYRWLQDRVSIVREKRTPARIRGLLVDITKSKAAAEKLQQEKNLNESLIQHLPNIFFLFNVKGQFLLWNQALEKITGYNHEEVASMHPIQFFDTEEQPIIQKHIEIAFTEGFTMVEAPVLIKDGTKIPYHFTASSLTYKGQPCIYGIGVDISENQQTLLEISLMLNNTDEAFVLLDKSAKIVSFNCLFETQHRESLGVEVQKGHSILDYTGPERLETEKAILDHVLQGQSKESENFIRLANGEIRIFALRYKPARNESGKIIGIFITSTDVTAERKAVLALRESKAALQQVLNSSLDIICAVNAEGQFVLVSAASEDVWGYKPEELEGKFHSHFVLEEDRSKTSAVMQEILLRKKVTTFENRYRHKNGKLVTMLWSAYWDEQKQLVHCVAKDATDLKNAEEHLLFSEKRFKALVQNGSDLIAILDTEANFTYVSPTSQSVLGTQPKDYIGKNVFDLLHPGDKESVYAKFFQVKLGKRIEIQPFRIQHKDGTWKWIETVITNMLDEPAVNGFVANSRDVTERIENELKLQRSEELFKALVQEGSDLIAILNPDGIYQYVSPNYFQYVGYIDDELLGKNTFGFFHPDDVQRVQEEFSRLQKEKRVKSSPYRFRHKTEGWHWVQSIGTNLMDNDTVAGIVVNSVDITEIITAKEELNQAFEEKNTILESIGDGFFTIDRKWTVNYWNKAAEQILCTKREDILGKNLWGAFDNTFNLFNTLTYNELHKAFDTDEAVHFEDYLEPLKMWVEISAFPSKKGLTVYFKDISLRKEATEQIRQSNERFEKVAQATNDAIWDWDIVNNTLYWGNGFKTHFGYDFENAPSIPENWNRHIHPEDFQMVLAEKNKLIQSRTESHFQADYRYLKADGSFAYVIDRGMVIRDKNGKAIRMVGAMTDISLRRKFEESLYHLNQTLDLRARELAISNAELEQFAYVASHDLQEPLRMVTSFMSQLESRYGKFLDDKAKLYIHFAVDGAKRMRQIILDLLEFSRVGKHSDKLECIDLEELIEEILILYKKQIREKKAIIKVDQLPAINSHRTPILQIFQNLIGNALKYSKKGIPPEIILNGTESGTKWLFSVKDNGIGIDREYHEKIFVIFQRLHNKDEYGGTGMGLAICKKIVENFGGEIWVESEEGKGSTFYFTMHKI